jgi:hypothetical protein
VVVQASDVQIDGLAGTVAPEISQLSLAAQWKHQAIGVAAQLDLDFGWTLIGNRNEGEVARVPFRCVTASRLD